MAATFALVLALLAARFGLKSDESIRVDTQEQMLQREKTLSQEMARLMEEIEQGTAPEEACYLSVRQYGIVAQALTLIAGACLLPWVYLRKPDSSEEEESNEEEDLGDADSADAAPDTLTPLPWQSLPDTRRAVKELVGELLGVCRVLSKKSYMPLIHPVVETDGTHEAWSVHEDSITYRPIVFLQPPPGHSFCVETHPTEQLPAPAPTIRVVQQCMCLREQQLGDVFCFLHHTEDELPQTAQDLYRLHYLCTGQYFDVEKFTYWFHLLVRSAWLLLPQSCHFQLKVLPSPNSLRLQLTSTSEKNICIEMKFQVQIS